MQAGLNSPAFLFALRSRQTRPSERRRRPGKETAVLQSQGEKDHAAQPGPEPRWRHPRAEPGAARLCELLQDSQLQTGTGTSDELDTTALALYPTETVEETETAASQIEAAWLQATVQLHQDEELAQCGQSLSQLCHAEPLVP